MEHKVVTRHMKGNNRATIHHRNMEKLHMLTAHIGKQINISGFSKFCNFFNFSYAIFYLILVMQVFFMDFLVFANFLFCFMQYLKAVKG